MQTTKKMYRNYQRSVCDTARRLQHVIQVPWRENEYRIKRVATQLRNNVRANQQLPVGPGGSVYGDVTCVQYWESQQGRITHHTQDPVPVPIITQ